MAHKLIAEVAQQVGDDVVRCIAMNSTDGLVRGTRGCGYRQLLLPYRLERLAWVVCSTCWESLIDNKPVPETEERWAIHRQAPSYEEQTPGDRDFRDRNQGC